MVPRLCLLIAATAFTVEASAAPRQPTDKWVVSFADDQCFAERNYGTASDPIYLTMKAPALGDVMQLGVMKKGKYGEPLQVKGYIDFDNAPPVRTTLFQFDNSSMGQHVLLTNVRLADLAPIRQAGSMRIRAEEEGTTPSGTWLSFGAALMDESFALGQMGAVLDALSGCTANLRKIWLPSSHLEGHPGLREGPKGDLSKIFNAEDYPALALMKNQTGPVSFVILIDLNGRVVDCTVVHTSGVAALDAQSCAIVQQRARFQPAIGLDGKPAKSALVQTVTWLLED